MKAREQGKKTQQNKVKVLGLFKRREFPQNKIAATWTEAYQNYPTTSAHPFTYETYFYDIKASQRGTAMTLMGQTCC